MVRLSLSFSIALLLSIVAPTSADSKLENGAMCQTHGDCRSGACYPYPDMRNYCVDPTFDCSDPRTDGVSAGYTMQFRNESWTCIQEKGWGPAQFSNFGDGVGRHRQCLLTGCEAGKIDCKAARKEALMDCGWLKAIEIELATPMSVVIAEGRDSAERASVHTIPDYIRSRLEEFFAPDTLNKVRYRVAAAGKSELLRYTFEWLNTSAIVVDHVIIFRDEQDALHNVRLWAHELEHVIQYGMLGVDGFAQRWMRPDTRGDYYDDDRTTIEGAATARAVYVCSYISC